MHPINLSSHTNYIACFLSLNCNYSCSYCINHTSGLNPHRKHLKAKDWVTGLNRINCPKNLPLSFQGGEPTIHPGFYDIINGIDKKFTVDLLTNIQFNPELFSNKILASRFERDLPYPSIRVSFHPEVSRFSDIFEKVLYLQKRGYSIGIFSVEHPLFRLELDKAAQLCHKHNIIFKLKELLGKYDETEYGDIRYKESCYQEKLKSCLCKNSELLIAPDGKIYKCHHDLYNKILPLGNILDDHYHHEFKFRECHFFGNCNPCDVKIKNNRFQEFGHSSVEIKDIR